jgi:hypothetical protein
MWKSEMTFNLFHVYYILSIFIFEITITRVDIPKICYLIFCICTLSRISIDYREYIITCGTNFKERKKHFRNFQSLYLSNSLKLIQISILENSYRFMKYRIPLSSRIWKLSDLWHVTFWRKLNVVEKSTDCQPQDKSCLDNSCEYLSSSCDTPTLEDTLCLRPPNCYPYLFMTTSGN